MTIAIFLVSLFFCLMIGVPVAFALLFCAIPLMLYIGNFDVEIVALNLINGADSFPLLAIPFFMLAGEVMNVGGLSRRIIAVPMTFLRHKRGGLGFVAILAAMIIAALSGSAVADTAAVAAILVPLMSQSGYEPGRSSGLIAASGIIAPIIPPSIPMVVFGVAGGVSITKLFLAGIVPGLLMGGLLMICWAFLIRKSDVGTLQEKASWAEIRKTFSEGLWALILPILIVGGLRLGVFTPTEAASVAAVYALLVSMFIYRELRPSQLFVVFYEAAKTTSIIMFLVAAALISSWLMTIAELPMMVSSLLKPLINTPFLLMLCIVIIVLIVGMVMDLMPIVLILTPVFMPVIKLAKIDPVYFGIVFILTTTIGLITPPVGNVLNVLSGVTKQPLDKIIRGVWPFLLCHLFLVLLLLIFPSIVMAPLKFLLKS